MSQIITAAQLKAIAGSGARADLVAAIVRGWPNAVAKAGLTTRLRAAHFLAQIMIETGGLQILEESGAYRAPRILAIFGAGHHSAGVTEAEARRIAALPVAQRGPVLFNRVYGVGNPRKMREFDNTGPNDGWLYRGGGMMQATGKSNYAAMEKKTGLPLVAHPELLHQPDSAFTAAYLEWAQGGRCNAAADRDDVETVRHIINGGKNGLAECRAFLAKAKRALADYAPTPAVALDPVAPDATALAPPAPIVPDAAPPNVQPLDPGVVGDPVLYAVQTRLKARRYSPGVIDGRWGSGISGALSGFMNDRGLVLPLPSSIDEFHGIADQVRAELDKAEAEGWFRPVSEARAKADPHILTQLAPEITPARRNFLVALWGSTTAGAGAVYQTVSGYVSDAWDFFTEHRDVVDDHPGLVSAAWDHVATLPAGVWFALGAGGLAFITYNSWRAIRTSTLAVQTGERQ
ncbi:glycoside hydrolase family 19 protein [Bradyrhizobium betae]|uniref:glycoside hydrolase family 19 protein n=1 Tax=Bradyrhizobium betae TaxID=244734 RepID=UPI0012B69405|nr:glycoside hydrolase family 19 protein [Bradyrhizobium betae]MCS3725958.1 putative chitinase/peptidoglycan hydrolase-like protein with peptidoglycan-binding domain [Bradyrhizobium betae]